MELADVSRAWINWQAWVRLARADPQYMAYQMIAAQKQMYLVCIQAQYWASVRAV